MNSEGRMTSCDCCIGKSAARHDRIINRIIKPDNKSDRSSDNHLMKSSRAKDVCAWLLQQTGNNEQSVFI